MKKSKNKKPNQIPQISEVQNDMESLYKMIGDLNKTKLEDLDMDELTSKLNVFEEKYKNILPEESKEDLDTEK